MATKVRTPPVGSKVNWKAYDWTPWAIEVAPYVLPILIQRAREGDTISYSELAELLLRKYGFPPKWRKTIYGRPVGLVGHVLEDLGKVRSESIPPINVIVVRKRSKLPGDGADALLRTYFKGIGRRFSTKRRLELTREAINAVLNYGEQWVSVAEDLGAELLPPRRGKVDDGVPIKLPKLPSGYAPESQEHKALKEWVRHRPELFSKFGKFKTGLPEVRLSSGDRLDVHFKNKGQRLAVEVKPSHASQDELKKGVYQVVKYRAVMRAEQRSMVLVPNAQAILVSITKPTSDIRILMQRLQVIHIQVPPEAEKSRSTN